MCSLAEAAIQEDPDCLDHEDDGEEERRWDVPVIRYKTAESANPPQPTKEHMDLIIEYGTRFCDGTAEE